MFLNELGVSILFRLINLGALTLFIVYIFKKYAIEDIKKQIVEKEQAVSDLETQADSLLRNIHTTEQAIQNDIQACEALKLHVVEWRKQAESTMHRQVLEKD